MKRRISLKKVLGITFLSMFCFAMPVSANVDFEVLADEEFESVYEIKNLETGQITTSEVYESEIGTEVNDYVGDDFVDVEEAEPFGIIGSDDRTRVSNTKKSPYRWICYLRITWPNGSTSQGTGALVGQDLVATAGHCIYSRANGGFAKSVAVYPSINGSLSAPYGSASAKLLVKPRAFKNDSTDELDRKYDLGAIVLNKSIGKKIGYFGFSVSNGSLNNVKVRISGYPSDHPYQMWTMDGRITQTFSCNIRYTIDTMQGQSGSPVFRKDSDGRWRLNGIHTAFNESRQFNMGTKINRSYYNMLVQYR